MNYETATNDDLEIKLGELLGMGRFAALTAPRYCTDWNATMPLAVENSVGLEFFGERVKSEKAIKTSFGNEFIAAYDENKNPLRAIVICLIKVLENKQ